MKTKSGICHIVCRLFLATKSKNWLLNFFGWVLDMHGSRCVALFLTSSAHMRTSSWCLISHIEYSINSSTHCTPSYRIFGNGPGSVALPCGFTCRFGSARIIRLRLPIRQPLPIILRFRLRRIPTNCTAGNGIGVHLGG